MPYEVASGENLSQIKQKVEEMRKMGYKPQGGIAVLLYPNPKEGLIFYFYQAMVKPVEEDLSRALSKDEEE